MNVSLLRLASRHPRTGVRTWNVPGFGNTAKLIPESALDRAGWIGAFFWPASDPDGYQIMRGVDLGRHRALARQAARAMINRS